MAGVKWWKGIRRLVRRAGGERIFIALIMVVAVIEGAIFASITPKWHAPDEGKYYREIQTLAETGRFESLTGHPPLYPAVATLPYAFGGTTSQKVFLIRFLGTLFNAATIWMAYKAASELFQERKLAQLIPPVLIACNLQFNFIGASVNSDALLTLLATTFFYLSIRTLHYPLTAKKALGLTLTGVVGVLIKQRFFVILPLYIPVLAAGLYRRFHKGLEPSVKSWRAWGISAGLVVAFVVGLLTLVSELAPVQLPEASLLGSLRKVWSVLLLPGFITKLFFEFWGYFDWLFLPMRDGSYYFFLLLTLLAVSGLVAATVRRARRLGLGRALTAWGSVIWVFMGIALTLAVYSVAQYYLQQGGGAQGRYLFIVMTPITILLGRGLSEIFPSEYQRRGLAAVTGSLLLINFTEIIYRIIPYYY
ncbi:MAG: hypothetical protein ACYC1U_04245 [Candidatus Aquicultorales bacterium]